MHKKTIKFIKQKMLLAFFYQYIIFQVKKNEKFAKRDVTLNEYKTHD